LIEKNEAKVPRRQNGEFYLKKKVWKKVHQKCGVRRQVLLSYPAVVDTVIYRDEEYGGCCTREWTCLF
jgi:hypothetical protein